MNHGRHPQNGRWLFSAFMSSLPRNFAPPTLPSPQFIVFVACDATNIDDEYLQAFARSALNSGAVYLCAWGPDCQRIENAFDHLVETGQAGPSNLLTTSHSKETLESAMWFAMSCAWPPKALPSGGFSERDELCDSVVFLSVNGGDWDAVIHQGLADPEWLWHIVQTHDGEEPR